MKIEAKKSERIIADELGSKPSKHRVMPSFSPGRSIGRGVSVRQDRRHHSRAQIGSSVSTAIPIMHLPPKTY